MNPAMTDEADSYPGMQAYLRLISANCKWFFIYSDFKDLRVN